MKKLMTMLAAAATAFGLYAAEPITSTSFEGTSEFDEGGNLKTEGTAWTASTDPDAKLRQGAYNNDDYVYTTDNDRYDVFGDDQDSYLSIKTALDKPTAYAIGTDGASVEDGAVYIDQLVKFTAADDDIAIADDMGAKIAFYVKDLTEAESPKAETNLYVVAGKYVGGSLEKTVYEVKKGIDADAWHRLTVKAIKATSGSVGFEVFLDAVALTTGVNAYDGVEGYLTDSARPLNNVKKLFPSLIENVKSISSIAYAGQGSIDDIIATVDEPGTWAEDKIVSVTWDEKVTALTYQVNNGDPITADVTAKVIEVPYESGLSITVDPTFAENWGFGGFDGEGFTPNDKTIAFKSDTGSAAIISKDTTPRIEMDGQFYPNFKEAIAAIDGNYPAELKLNQNVTVDADADIGTDAQFNGDVTIDLNGKTITGTATGFDGFVINCQGNLTIIDNSDGADGAIVMADGTDYTGVVGVLSPDENDRTLTISAGVFEGQVYAAEAGEGFGAVVSAISGGKFAYAANTTDGDEFALTCAEGFTANPDAEQDPTYWVVEGLPSATISLTETNVTVSRIADGDEVYEDDVLEFEVEADKYYGDVTVTVGNSVLTPGEEGTYTYTVTAADIANKEVKIEVTATAIEYKLTYTDEAEDPFTSNVVFTAANYTELTLWDGEREGYTKDGDSWLDEEGNPITTDDQLRNLIWTKIEAGEDELNVTLNGYTWTQEATEYTVTLSYEATQIDPDTVVALVNGEPAAIDKNAFTAAEGAAIVITATAQEGYENVKFTVGDGQAGATCEFTLEADTTVVIAASKKAVLPDQPIDVPEEYADADAYAAAINDGTVAKADLLKAPYGKTTDDYLDLFEAVADGDKVKMELTEDAKTQLEEIAEAAAETALAVDAGTVTIAEPIAGLYYSLNVGTTLEGMKTLEANANRTFDGTKPIEFTIDKTQPAGFWKVLVTPTVVTPDVE